MIAELIVNRSTVLTYCSVGNWFNLVEQTVINTVHSAHKNSEQGIAEDLKSKITIVCEFCSRNVIYSSRVIFLRLLRRQRKAPQGIPPISL